MKLKKPVGRRQSGLPLTVTVTEETDSGELKMNDVDVVPNFDDFLETLSNSDDEDEDESIAEEDGNPDEGDGQESSDEELAAALEESDEEKKLEGSGANGDVEDDEEEMEFENESDMDENEVEPKSKNSFRSSMKKIVSEELNVELRPYDEESDEGDDGETEESHKAALQNLEQSDPEFFAYLRENDAQLLDFGDEDDEDEDDSDDDEEETLTSTKGKDSKKYNIKGTKGLHKPSAELEVASDSEAEEELLDEEPSLVQDKVDNFLKKGIVNLYVIAEWDEKLTSSKDLSILTNVIEAFDCAVQNVLTEEKVSGLKWKVKGSAHFNALMRLCIRNLKGFCVRYLLGSNNEVVAMTQFDKNPFDVKEKHKAKWVKLRPKIKVYMASLRAFLKSMGNPDAIASVLRHCQRMSGFFAIMTTKSYKLLRVLINVWATGEDSCRVIAFLSIIRMANYNKNIFLIRIFKQMYMAYVANCKFTSVNSWPAINFLRSSLVEVYLLDTAQSYSVAFPFIRQLAIHLRNAVTAGTNQHVNQSKKEASRIVYSWQFVHSIHLWCDLLAQALGGGDEKLKLLVYPVVQICLGTIKLIPTRKYVPLRFHIIRTLINLQDKSKIFIPILPTITEVLHLTDFSKKTVAKFSVRPLNLMCCLKADASESGYFKAVSEAIFNTLLGACNACGTELAFPEIISPTLTNLKYFLKKKCRNFEISKKFKTLIDKIEANAAYIKIKRAKGMEDGLVSLSDTQSQRILQAQMLVDTPGPPLVAFAKEYFKSNSRIAAKSRKLNTQTREEKLIPKPSSKKYNSGSKSKSTIKLNSGVSMFSKSDSEDDDSEFTTKLDQPEVASKKGKKRKAVQNYDVDDHDEGGLEESRVSKQKKSKYKQAKNITLPTFQDIADDMEDELVDFELSD